MPKRETVTFEDKDHLTEVDETPSAVVQDDALGEGDGDETSDSEYDEEYDQMSTLVDLLTNDDGENVVDALTKALSGIQDAIESNTKQLEKMTKEVKRGMSKSA